MTSPLFGAVKASTPPAGRRLQLLSDHSISVCLRLVDDSAFLIGELRSRRLMVKEGRLSMPGPYVYVSARCW